MEVYSLKQSWADYYKGGPGSGHFNHAGRPGLVGGSASDGDGEERLEFVSGKNPLSVSLREYTGPYMAKYDSDKPLSGEQLKLHDNWIARELEWDVLNKKALSEGRISIEDAIARGLRLHGPESNVRETPPILYHITTSAGKVLDGNLKPRDEIATEDRAGLGGGSDDTVSFTEDRKTALGIYDAMVEARSVARGETTIKDMLDAASDGKSADRSWINDMIRSGTAGIVGDKEWKVGNPLPLGWTAAINGQQIESGFHVFAKKESEIRKLGGTPVGEGWVGGDGERRYSAYLRPATEEEKLDSRFSAYKTFAFWREQAGGALDPLFFCAHPEQLAKKPLSDIKLLRADMPKGYKGYTVGALGEWRTWSGRGIKLTVDSASGPRKYIYMQNVVVKGGPGSGHFGHAGRPGLVGGSSTEGEEARAGAKVNITFEAEGDRVPFLSGDLGLSRRDLDKVFSVVGDRADVRVQLWGDDTIDISCSWNPNRGKDNTGYFSMSIDPRRKKAELGSFRLGKNLQNKDTATQVLDGMENTVLKKFNVKEYSVFANISIGTYAWARMGFDFETKYDLKYNMQNFKEYAGDMVANHLDKGKITEREALRIESELNTKIKELKTANDIAACTAKGFVVTVNDFNYGNRDVPKDMKMHIGKAFFLDSHDGWNGVKKLR